MKSNFFKILIWTFLSFCMIFGGCGGNNPDESSSVAPLEPSNVNFDQSTLYGLCYEMYVRQEMGSLYDMDKDVQLLKNMGVTSVRMWIHATDFLKNPTTVNESKCASMHTLLKKFIDANIDVVGMSHTNFNGGTATSGKPARDITANSVYVKWLENYRLSFKTLATEFSEVKLWEMDNEVNNTDFMKNTLGESVYTQKEMAAIATDIFYYASLGIHEGNPNAKSVMGGLVGAMNGSGANFLQLLYDNIASGNFGYRYGVENQSSASKDPDDYFEIACWHPYVSGTFRKSVFKKFNDEMYAVVLQNEGKHKPVIFSEVGFSNSNVNETIAAKYTEEMFEVCANEMPYVTHLLYYKFLDYADPERYWTHTISRYGLFYDPNPSRSYTNNENDEIVTPGAPKPVAYAFQRAAGGMGDLTLLQPEEN